LFLATIAQEVSSGTRHTDPPCHRPNESQAQEMERTRARDQGQSALESHACRRVGPLVQHTDLAHYMGHKVSGWASDSSAKSRSHCPTHQGLRLPYGVVQETG